MIDHGDSFTLLRQSKPTFTRSRGGGFDTGFRRFKCHMENATTLLEETFRVGFSDAALLEVATGGTYPGYLNMLLANAALEQEEGDRAIIRAEFEGLMFGKKGSVEFDTVSHEHSAQGSASGFTILRSSHLHVPVPTVTHTWVSIKGRPSAVTPGSAMTPPGITAAETEQVDQYHADFVIGEMVLFEGWILATRKMRSPGDAIKSKVWEVVDTYQFQVTKAPFTI